MKGKCKKLPEALKKQVLLRSGGSAVFFLLFLYFLWSAGDAYMLFPCFLFFCVVTGNGIWFFSRCVYGQYVRLQGECIRTEAAGFRKRIRSFYLAYETGVVKVPVKSRIRNLREGDMVSVYIADNAPVYEKEGVFLVGDYYALEINGRK